MTTYRRLAIAVLAAASILLTGCSTERLPVMQAADASTAGVVAAIRLSPQLHDIDRGASVGYVLLIDDKGQARALKVGAMDTGHLTWSRRGLFFSDTKIEYLLDDKRLTSIDRGSEEEYETARFPDPEGDGFIAVYNVGFGDREYLARVTTGDGTTTRSWDLTGMFESVSQCGGLVVAMTDINELGPSFAVPGSRTDALVQLYPEPPDQKSAVLATLPIPKGGFVTGSFDAPCDNGTVFTLAAHSDDPDTTLNERPVIRAWNTRTGQHTVISLVTESGVPLDVVSDDLMERPGRIIAGRYLWIDRAGRVFSADLSTGVTRVAFKVALTSPEMGEAQFEFTEKSVYVLDVGQNHRAPLDLSSYDLATGKRTKLLSIPGTGAVHHGLDMIIRDLALNPEWVKARETALE